MADTKLSALTAISAVALEDLFYVVDDPGGTPAEKKATGTQVRAAMITGTLADVEGLTPSDGGFIVGDGSNFVVETTTTARTSLGVGTGDSPQFTAVNVGHASDTTLARASAGVLSIEGGTASGLQVANVVFPATQSASADANTLDDYEEGTWTPTLGGTSTYTVQTGRYVKVGHLVHITGRFVVNSIGSGSTSIVSGLPFTSVTLTNAFHPIPVSTFTSFNSGGTWVTLTIGSGGTTMGNGFQDANDANSSIGAAMYQNSSSIGFGGTYEAGT